MVGSQGHSCKPGGRERKSLVKGSELFIIFSFFLILLLVQTEYSTDGVPVTYRFSVGDKGFIVVSATDLANPVLAFSLESNYKEGIFSTRPSLKQYL